MTLIDAFYFDFRNPTGDSPTWFDWLTLILTIGAIVCSYLIADRTFKREQEAQKKANNRTAKQERKIFNKFLNTLSDILSTQKVALKRYISSDYQIIDVALGTNSTLISNIDIKNLYTTQTDDYTNLNNLLLKLPHVSELQNRINDSVYIFDSKLEAILSNLNKISELHSNFQHKNIRQIDLLQSFTMSRKSNGSIDELNNKLEIAFNIGDRQEIQKLRSMIELEELWVTTEFVKNVLDKNSNVFSHNNQLTPFNYFLMVNKQIVNPIFDYLKDKPLYSDNINTLFIFVNQQKAEFEKYVNLREGHRLMIMSIIDFIDDVNETINEYQNR